MLLPPKPMSNLERQREFIKRNPGYYTRLRKKKQAELQPYVEALNAAQATMIAAKSQPLMLPAPVEMPRFPGLNTIAEKPLDQRVPVEVPISRDRAA